VRTRLAFPVVADLAAAAGVGRSTAGRYLRRHFWFKLSTFIMGAPCCIAAHRPQADSRRLFIRSSHRLLRERRMLSSQPWVCTCLAGGSLANQASRPPIASCRNTICTPRTPFTICVIRRSATTLANASPWVRASPCSLPIRSSIASSAIITASSRSSSNPNVIQAIGVVSARSLRSEKVSAAEANGHSIAVDETSPSPCRA